MQSVALPVAKVRFVGPIGTVLAHVVRRLTVDWMRLVILVLGITTVITCYTFIFVGFR